MDSNSTDILMQSSPSEPALAHNESNSEWNGSDVGERDLAVRLLLTGKTPSGSSSLISANRTLSTVPSQGYNCLKYLPHNYHCTPISGNGTTGKGGGEQDRTELYTLVVLLCLLIASIALYAVVQTWRAYAEAKRLRAAGGGRRVNRGRLHPQPPPPTIPTISEETEKSG